MIFLGSGSPAFLLCYYFLAGLGLGFLFLGDSGFGFPITTLFSGSHFAIYFSYYGKGGIGGNSLSNILIT